MEISVIKKTLNEAQQKEEEKNDHQLEVTARMIRTVYVENKLTLPFLAHSSLVLLQRTHGVNMGCHHYERTGARRMTEHISKMMHDTLIDSLTSTNKPISIIVDGSTDPSQTHFLIVYFQTIEENNPVIYFYKLIELNAETGVGLYEAIYESWRSDNILNHMKKNLVGFASDGARSMTGKNNGFISYIRHFADNPIYAVHCMAHRLELAIERAFKNNEMTLKVGDDIEYLVNNIFKFYNKQGYKRKYHLKETCKQLKEKYRELTYIFNVRWIATDYKATKKILNMWRVLAVDLDKISKSTSFTPEVQIKAKKMHDMLVGKRMLISINFLLDLLHQLSYWSLEMQKRTGLLIGFNKYKEDMITGFEDLKTQSGKYVATLLLDIKCKYANEVTTCKNLDDFYNLPIVFYKEVQLIDDTSVRKLNEYRTVLLDNLVKELNSYFPNGNTKDFEVFSPVNMPKPGDTAKIHTYGITEVARLTEYFGLCSRDIMLDEWSLLLQSIINSPNYCNIKTGETTASSFWSELGTWKEIAWKGNVRKLIWTVLSIPISSAEAERGFSTLNNIRNPRRSSLSPAHMNDIMRIKLNGPDEIEKFIAVKYARKWVDNHMRTDDSRGVRSADELPTSLVPNELQKQYMLSPTIF